MTQKFTDIVLDEEELTQVESDIEAYSQKVYGGAMEAHSKSILRQKYIQEYKQGLWDNQDFKAGYDDGESQTVPDFNHYEGAE